MKMIKQGEAVLDGGKRRPHYFNGRVLTAEALQEEHGVQQSRIEDVGRVMGEGVVKGLNVYSSNTEPPVTSIDVTPGTAVSRAGTILKLTQPVTVELTPSEEGAASTGTGFTVCATEPSGETVLSGQGLYLVTLAPAKDLEGRTSRVALGAGEASGCGRRYVVEGVTLRLRDAADLISVESAIRSAETPAVKRNVVAHAAFGSFQIEERAAELPSLFAAARTALHDPAASFEPPGGRDPLNRLRRTGVLPVEEVPLALLQWSDNGIVFVDVWAVRRRVHTTVRSALAQVPVEDNRRAIAEAALRQFETHVDEDELLIEEVFGLFRFLPAAGLLELPASRTRSFLSSVRAFLERRQQVQQMMSIVEISQDLRGQEAGGSNTLKVLRRYFEELGAWSKYARVLEENESDLKGEIESARRHAEFLENGREEAEGAVTDLFATIGETVDAAEFIEAATAMGQSSVNLRMALSLPWWLVDVDITLIDGADVGPLFDRSFRQEPIFIRQLSLDKLRKRIIDGEATRADLSRRLVPPVQLHLVRNSLPPQITDLLTRGGAEEEFTEEVGEAFLLFSRQTQSVSLGRFPDPWPVRETLEEDTYFRAAYKSMGTLSLRERTAAKEEFVAEEVGKLREELGVSTQEAETLFDRFGVRSARDVRKIDRHVLRRSLKLSLEETNRIFRRTHWHL